MKENISNYMKVGTIHFMSYPEVMNGHWPSLDSLKKILLDDYFDAVEISWNKDPALRAQAAELIKQSNITVAYGSQPRLLTTGMNINDPDEEKRLAALATLKEGVDEACELGAVGFAFMSGKYEEATKDRSFDALVKSTRELCAYAQARGDMPVLLEVFDFDVDKKSLIGPAAYACEFADIIAAEFDNFGLLTDLSHLPQTRETPREGILPIRKHVRHAHIGNAVVGDPALPAYGDAHPRFYFPDGENGADELAEFLKVLFEIGYLGKGRRPIVSFEVKPFGSEDPEITLAGCKRVLNEAWARLEL